MVTSREEKKKEASKKRRANRKKESKSLKVEEKEKDSGQSARPIIRARVTGAIEPFKTLSSVTSPVTRVQHTSKEEKKEASKKRRANRKKESKSLKVEEKERDSGQSARPIIRARVTGAIEPFNTLSSVTSPVTRVQ
ncbi:unnamed protein product [Natator depressus]